MVIYQSQQIYFMKIILLTALFISLLVQVSAHNNYTQSAGYKLTNKCDKIAFSDDQETTIMYSSKDVNTFFYRSYDMKLTVKQQLKGVPLYLQTFTNNIQGNAIFYALKGGIIYLGNFTSQGTAQIILKTIENCSISKVSPSPDKTLFAASCQDSNQLIIGNLLQSEDKIEPVNVTFPIKKFRWHPNQNIVLITGINETKNEKNTSSLQQYDCDKKFFKDLSDKVIEGDKIQDVEYSPDGSSFAYITYDSNNTEIITIIHPTSNTTKLIASGATQLIELKRKGNLLTAYDEANIFVWVFDGDYYGKYQSTLKSPGLSPTGGQIYTIDPLNKQVVVSRFCPLDQVFKNDQLACAACESPCKSCFQQQQKCSSCRDSFYLDEKTYSCQACIENCKNCNASACQTCLSGFYLNETRCDSCGKAYLGCLTCTSKECKKCDASNNWRLNIYNKCVCQIGFVQVGQQCQKCPLNCFVCLNTSICQICDFDRSPDPIDEKCVCDVKYFQNPFSKQCQPCVVGCNQCDNKITCMTCDNAKNWTLVQDTKVCVCRNNFIQINRACISCNILIKGCIQCQKADQCQTCMDGYDLDENLHCNKHPEDSGVGIIVIIIIGTCVLIGLGVGSFFIKKAMRKNKGKKVQTLLESQAENQEDETN